MNTLRHLEARREEWQTMEGLLKKKRSALTADEVVQLSHGYRSLCTDISLAGVCHLSEGTVRYLHDLLARVRAFFYGRWRWKRRNWRRFIFVELPRLLQREPFVKLSFAVFWGPFLVSCFLAMGSGVFVESVIGPVMAAQLEAMYADGFAQMGLLSGAAGTNFYLFHNVSIGLQCFAMGLLFGLGSVYALLFNGVFLGTCFGFMLTGPYAATFGEFVMAHGPLELTGICLSGAAGLRLGYSLIETKGMGRWQSLRATLSHALPIMGLAASMIAMAAFIEGFISPSGLPIEVKALVMVVTALTIVVYFFSPNLGNRR